jgi:predicted nucleic acid-binding protein
LKAAYVDTSCLVAIAFGEDGAARLSRRLESFDELFTANLLEAELRATFAREAVPLDPTMLTWVTWVVPDRPLSREITQVLTAGYLRGADLWHLACALFLVESPREIAFVSLDARQSGVAAQLGFRS